MLSKAGSQSPALKLEEKQQAHWPGSPRHLLQQDWNSWATDDVSSLQPMKHFLHQCSWSEPAGLRSERRIREWALEATSVTPHNLWDKVHTLESYVQSPPGPVSSTGWNVISYTLPLIATPRCWKLQARYDVPFPGDSAHIVPSTWKTLSPNFPSSIQPPPILLLDSLLLKLSNSRESPQAVLHALPRAP